MYVYVSSFGFATGTIDDIIEPNKSPLENKSFLTADNFGHTFGTQYNFESEDGAIWTKK